MFSSRLPRDLRPNALSRLRARLGGVPFDLTESNPTRCGLPYPEGLLDGLAEPRGLSYRPEPRGLPEARRAVADELGRGGRAADPDSQVLVASTSEAYALLFKLLCDPGETVLVPAPSYPLFEHLAALEGVRAVAYPLDPRGGWQPDLRDPLLDAARAVVLVHPNNPTGSIVEWPVAEKLLARCAARGLPVVADEVFLDYPLGTDERLPSFLAADEGLVFVLGGLSKQVGLPQLKLSWIVAAGARRLRREALERLAFIADGYLSVATPVQLALPGLLVRGADVRRAILERCRSNLATLQAMAGDSSAVEVIPPRAGWSAVVRYPNVIEEESFALELLGERGVAVWPGYFFDFAEPGYLALSLLPAPEIFAEGAGRIFSTLEEKL